MKKIIMMLCLVGMVGCASYQPPKQYDIKKSYTIQKSFDATWQKIINYFAVRNIPIKNLDKSSGFISTDYQLMTNDATAEERKSGKFKDCDCGEPSSTMHFENPSCNLNITLNKIDSLQTDVMVNIFYKCNWYYITYNGLTYNSSSGTPTQGNSTGNFEKEIFEYIGVSSTNKAMTK